MAEDHEREAVHPPPKTKGNSRSAVGAHQSKSLDGNHIEFDFEEYAHFFKDADLSDQQKLELCAAVWRIMSEFVLLGWGVHPTRQACGKDKASASTPTKSPQSLIDCPHTDLITEFEECTDQKADRCPEGVDV